MKYATTNFPFQTAEFERRRRRASVAGRSILRGMEKSPRTYWPSVPLHSSTSDYNSVVAQDSSREYYILGMLLFLSFTFLEL